MTSNNNDDNVHRLHANDTDNVYRLVADETTLRRPNKEIRIHSYDAGAEIASIVDQAVDALMEANMPIFKRNHRLIILLWEERTIAFGQKIQVASIKPANIGHMDYTLNKNGVARFFIKKKGRGGAPDTMEPFGAPERALSRILDVGHWKFHTLDGMIHCPTMRPDGSLLLQKGFDRASNTYAFWDDKLTMPSVALWPTKDEAQAALQLFIDLLAGFPFKNALDRAVAIAAIMTPVLRVAFDHAPAFLVLAHQSGTGKSFMQDVIVSIAHGQKCPVINDTGDSIELEKRLNSSIMKGMPIVALDNMTHDLEGSMLCQMITQHAVSVRVLGKSEMRDIHWLGTVIANGNNVRVVGDMVRRTLTCNMDAPQVQPETRTFAFDPVECILADRGKYINAALTIAKAYHISESKVKLASFGGFDGWSRFVREPLVWLGMPDPVKCQEQLRREDPGRGNARELMQGWRQWVPLDKFYTASQIAALAPPGSEFEDLLQRMAGGANRQINSRRLGMWLTSIHGQVHEVHSPTDVTDVKTMRIELDNRDINKYKLVVLE